MLKPGKDNSRRIIIDNANPKEPPIKPIIIYAIPIKIWFVINNKLSILEWMNELISNN